jgi:hypothetical protein
LNRFPRNEEHFYRRHAKRDCGQVTGNSALSASIRRPFEE